MFHLLLFAVALLSTIAPAVPFASPVLSETVQSSDDKLTNQEKLEDLKFLAKELAQRHINLFATFSQDDFQQQVDQLVQKISQLSDQTFGFELSKLVAAADDGHTSVVWDLSSMHYYGINVEIFDDQVAVIAAQKPISEVAGARLVSVNGQPVDEVLKKLRPYFSVDNEFGFRNKIRNNFNNADLLAYACNFQQVHEAEFVFEKSGRTISRKLRALPQSEASKIGWTFASNQFPRYAQKSNLNFWNDWLKDSKTLYFKYNRCVDAAGFEKLVNGTAAFVKQNQVHRFVVDLRDNIGGDSKVLKPLTDYLSNQQQFRQPGKLFVIVGRGTFSSGLWAAYDLKKLGAVVVGEPTGGKPNHFGEIKKFQLPNSKLTVFYSTRFWQFLDDQDPAAMQPDIRVEFTAEDYFAGRDPAMEAILEYRGK